MVNAVGREIPEEILKITGKDVFKGSHAKDGLLYKKAAPTVQAYVDPQRNKMVASVAEVLKKCGIKDGMTLSFHHHFRDGDYIVNMIMEEVHKMGVKDINICASSLGSAHDPIVPYIEDGTISSIESSGVRGKIGEAISTGKLKKLAIMRSHGGRVRALETGESHVDIAFIGAPTCDCYGNCRAIGGKSDCGVLSYSMVDAQYADKVVAITDCLVPYPNVPASISQVDVDYVVFVDVIGNPDKIVSNVVRLTTDPRELVMAESCTKVIAQSPYFKDGFSFQTGGGGAALAVNMMLKPYLKKDNIKMNFAIGGITKPMCELLDEGFVEKIVDAQVFDTNSIESIKTNPNHIEISISEYANPLNKGAYVNKLDFVVLGALEVDLDFNVNVVVGSDGIVRGAQGGHPDTSAGAKCAIVVAPLIRGRIPTICKRVVTVTTPGENVDVVVTDYGIAINPRRKDLLEAYKGSKLPLCTIEELCERAYKIVGKPDMIRFGGRVVGVIEARDGTIMDVVREVLPL